MTKQTHQVVIVGGGFGGLTVARSLKHAPVNIKLLDRRNYHLFQPLLYQVATGVLSPANIATPLRSILKRQKNVDVLLDEVLDFDIANQRVVCRDGSYYYDTLVVAAGGGNQYFGHDSWEPHAPGLKSLENAIDIRRRVLSAFEAAERKESPRERKPWMTFVVVGAGPTGVELAGAIGDLAQRTLEHDFRQISTPETRIFLLDGGHRILSTFPESLAAKAEQSLAQLGVIVRTQATVTDVQPDSVTFRCGETVETIATNTVLWAAGVKASPLGTALAKATGAELDRGGRVKVQPDLSLRNHPEIFVIGDLANVEMAPGKSLPGVAQPAIQGGTYVAHLIQARLSDRTLPPFRYTDRGSMATIGRNSAVADLGWLRVSGFFGFVMWLFVHLLFIEQRHNRFLVLIEWARNYFTGNRYARLITGETQEVAPRIEHTDSPPNASPRITVTPTAQSPVNEAPSSS